jgi:hypothetical protein
MRRIFIMLAITRGAAPRPSVSKIVVQAHRNSRPKPALRAFTTPPKDTKKKSLYLHGSTTTDLAYIRDNGLKGHLYISPISHYPIQTPADKETFDITTGYAHYAAKEPHTPAVGVFELKTNTASSNSIHFDDRRNTYYFESADTNTRMTLITTLDTQANHIDLPPIGQRTRREGSTALRMFVGWYGGLTMAVLCTEGLYNELASYFA